MIDVKETDLAYLAGLIDGDGSIGIWGGKRKRLTIQVNQKDPMVLYWIKEKFGGGIRRSQRRSQSKPEMFQWTITSYKMARPLIEKLIPYLIIKKDRAIKSCSSVCEGYKLYNKNLMLCYNTETR